MSKKYFPLKLSTLTENLIKQEFDDVLFALFEIEDICNSEQSSNIKNYMTMRLVTIIEQFCRKIIEIQIEYEPNEIPNEITTEIHKLDKIMKMGIADHTKKFIKSKIKYMKPDEIKSIIKIIIKTQISRSYTFQNVKQIEEQLKEYGISDIFDNDLKLDIKELISMRHDTVHTVINTNYNIQKGWQITKKLFMNILKKSHYKNKSLFYHIEGNYKNHIKEYEKAIECFDEAIKLEPADYRLHINKGISLARLGKYEDAIERYDEAIGLDSTDHRSYANKGITLNEFGKYEEAIECFDEAIKLEARDHQAYANKGVALNKLEKYEDAIKCFDEVIKLEPGDYQSYINKGITLDKLEKYEEAIK